MVFRGVLFRVSADVSQVAEMLNEAPFVLPYDRAGFEVIVVVAKCGLILAALEAMVQCDMFHVPFYDDPSHHAGRS